MSITLQVELSCHYVTGVPTNPIMLPMDNFTIKFIGELCPSNPVIFSPGIDPGGSRNLVIFSITLPPVANGKMESNAPRSQWERVHQNYRAIYSIICPRFSMDPESEKIEKKIESFLISVTFQWEI